jgi:endonuclease YncB( thermonuclease family)
MRLLIVWLVPLLLVACVKPVDREPSPAPVVQDEAPVDEKSGDEWETPAEPKGKLSGDPRPAGLHDLVIPAGTRLPVNVIHVVDADTVNIETREAVPRTFKLRLAGINAPECHKKRRRTERGKASSACASDDEAHGHASYLHLKKLLQGKSIHLTCKLVRGSSVCEQDRYRRLLATLWDGTVDVNRKMLEDGMAMAFTKYPHDDRAAYCEAELAARAARRGLWALARDVPGVLSLMSQKTRTWYKKHDDLCNAASEAAKRAAP